MGEALALDREIFYLINHGWANPFFDRLFPFITRLNNFIPVILALVVWLVWRGGRRGRLCLLGLALAVGIADPLIVRVIKPSVDRDRPCIELADTRLLASRKSSPSFPSAHAANMFAVATVFGCFYRRSLLVVVPFATLVALSRVYIGVHYPIDIAGGAVLGVAIGAFVVVLLRSLGRRVRWLAAGPALWMVFVCVGAGAAAPPGPSVAERLVAAALERTEHAVTYDGSYRRIPYPGGDVPDSIGVCTDLLIRSYRALGVDLQQAVHEDMLSDFEEYPQRWGLTRPDPNIDHRRVPNLQTFLERRGAALDPSEDAASYVPGDVVTWMLPGDLPHIGIVVNGRSGDGRRPLVVHNIGRGPVVEDVLFGFPITGHYRFHVAAASIGAG